MLRPFIGIFLSLVFSLSATVQDTNFVQTTYRNGLGNLTCMAWAPDGSKRLFLTVKQGTVRIIQDSLLLTTPFYTFGVYTGHNETGLLSLCFDPNYASNKYVYVFYTASGSKQKIVRITDNANVGQDTLTILDNLPTVGQNHDGGGISIGPDGKIYWAIGDQGSGIGVDLDSTTLASKIGRANLDGSPVNTNPYYNAGDGITGRDYIWARGFRNPFTQTWNPTTGKLWLNVVGTSYEQIFVVGRGDHGGWNNYEGGNQPTGYIKPVFSYATNGGFGGCITGGTFYTATVFPAKYRDNFFFGDYNANKVARLKFDANNVLTDSATFLTGINGVTDNSVGPDGALYTATHQGSVYRTRYKGAGTGIHPQGALSQTPGYTLNQNLPNPFQGATSFQYTVPALQGGRVSLSIYNLQGQLVRTLLEGVAHAGENTALWDGQDARGRALTAGIYYYQLVVKDAEGRVSYSGQRKMIRIR